MSSMFAIVGISVMKFLVLGAEEVRLVQQILTFVHNHRVEKTTLIYRKRQSLQQQVLLLAKLAFVIHN